MELGVRLRPVDSIDDSAEEPCLVVGIQVLTVEQGGEVGVALAELLDAGIELVGEVEERLGDGAHLAQTLDVVDACVAELHLGHRIAHAAELAHQTVVEFGRAFGIGEDERMLLSRIGVRPGR